MRLLLARTDLTRCNEIGIGVLHTHAPHLLFLPRCPLVHMSRTNNADIDAFRIGSPGPELRILAMSCEAASGKGDVSVRPMESRPATGPRKVSGSNLSGDVVWRSEGR